jgi:hypothetical protein
VLKLKVVIHEAYAKARGGRQLWHEFADFF